MNEPNSSPTELEVARSGASAFMIIIGILLLLCSLLSFSLAVNLTGQRGDDEIYRSLGLLFASFFVFAFGVALQKLHVIEAHVKDARKREMEAKAFGAGGAR